MHTNNHDNGNNHKASMQQLIKLFTINKQSIQSSHNSDIWYITQDKINTWECLPKISNTQMHTFPTYMLTWDYSMLRGWCE